MSNDLIARLRHQSDDHNALGMGIFREAADALTAQENALGFLRQISEQQAYEINQQAATIAEQAREIEALRADAQRPVFYKWGAPAAPTAVKPDLFTTDIVPRPLKYPLSDYHKAMSEGPLHYTWQDKPHRLVYDLIAAVRYYATPPRAALSDEQIRNLWFAAKPIEDGRPAYWNFARAVEAAHGIGGPRNE
jgi:hypothetical protein